MNVLPSTSKKRTTVASTAGSGRGRRAAAATAGVVGLALERP